MGPRRRGPGRRSDLDRASFVEAIFKEAQSGSSAPAFKEPKVEKYDPSDSDPKAVEAVDVEVDEDSIKWNVDGRPPIVRLKMGLKNTSRRPVGCDLVLICGTVPRAREKDDWSEWLPYDAREVSVNLPPGQVRKIDVTLRWPVNRARDRLPAIRRTPVRLQKAVDEGYARCRFIDAESKSGLVLGTQAENP